MYNVSKDDVDLLGISLDWVARIEQVGTGKTLVSALTGSADVQCPVQCQQGTSCDTVILIRNAMRWNVLLTAGDAYVTSDGPAIAIAYTPDGAARFSRDTVLSSCLSKFHHRSRRNM